MNRYVGLVFVIVSAVLVNACGSESRVGSTSQIQQGTLIRLSDGTVQGEIDGGARRFLGIPYAAPPVGNLRWRPPAPPVPWDGVRQATQFGARCAQTAFSSSEASNEEDCLYLNVWTPEPAPTKPLPVMLWLHAGSNTYYSASEPRGFNLGGLLYDGRVLAETRDVVVVTINYRLGVLGFLAHPALVAEDPANTGNQGLLDQQAALEWVRRNISAFGGDPQKVTIFGESSGGFNACLHVVLPGSRGLFHRAIDQSGGSVGWGCTARQPTAAEVKGYADRMIAAAGCAAASDALGCLRQVSVPDLLQAAGPDITDFVPVVDGNVLPDQPRALFASGDVARVPLIFGSTADEGSVYFIGVPPVTTEEEYLAALQQRFGDLAHEVAATYPVAHFASPQDALVRAVGDFWLVCPTYESGWRAAAAGLDVWMYNLARALPIPLAQILKLGAFHTSDVYYVFGSIEPPTAIDEALAAAMQEYWTRFARTGDPNGEGAPVWPRYEDASDQRLNLDAEIAVISGFRRPECEFWWGVYDREFE